VSETPSPGAVTEQRGDFMLLPPMRPTFGSMATIQQSPASFLVTRRPTAVTSAKLAHAIDDSLIGKVTGRARRSRAQRRGQTTPLDHLTESELPEVEEFEEALLPATRPPRPLQAKARTSAPASATSPASKSALPSRDSVRRAVTTPKRSTPATSPVEQPYSDPTSVELPPSTFPSIGASAPVVRRRGGGSPAMFAAESAAESVTEPEVNEPAPLIPFPLDDSQAIRRRQPRGRVNKPLQELDAPLPPTELIHPEPVSDFQGMQRRARDTDLPANSQPPTSGTPSTTSQSTSGPAITTGSAITTPVVAPATTPSQSSRPTINEALPAGIQGRARDTDSPANSQPPMSGAPSIASQSTGGPAITTPAVAPATTPSQSSRPTINETPPAAQTARPNETNEPVSLVHPVTELISETDLAAPTTIATTQPSSHRNEEPASTPAAPQTPLPSVTPAAMFSGPGETQRPTAHESAPGNTNVSRAERPILGSGVPTGIQRRAREGTGPSAGGLANLGASPQPKVQGPRQIVVPESVRQSLRATVGEPPSHVTVHEGEAAAQQANSVNAEAFTKNGQIFFASDAPVVSDRGQQLLAHELTHVMQQQGRGSSMPGEHTDEGQQLEHAARRVEKHMAVGRSEPTRPTPLHHRVTGKSDSAPGTTNASASSSMNLSSQTPRSGMQQYVPSSSEPSVFDAGVQRAEREPSRGILDGIGSTTSSAATSAWSKTRESLMGQLEQDFAGPPKGKKDADSRAKRLERQAAELYPYLQRRLRAELVRDLERRGRL
jgi:hypothetical protein